MAAVEMNNVVLRGKKKSNPREMKQNLREREGEREGEKRDELHEGNSLDVP